MSTIQSLDRALDVLSLIGKSGGRMGLSDIAQTMDIHKSTAYRTVRTLEEKGFLYRDEQSGAYSLGKGALKLGFSAAANVPITRISRPHMMYLSEKYNEYSVLTVVDDKDLFVISHYLGSFSTTFYSSLQGQLNSGSYRQAVIRCLLAYHSTLDPADHVLVDYIDHLLKRGINKNTPLSVEELIENLKEIQERGYAFEDGEFKADEICYAVPIFDKPGRPNAALSIFGTKARLSKFPEEVLIRELKNAATDISKRLRGE